MSLMEKIFGDLNAKEVKKVEKIVDVIESYDGQMQQLSDEELRAKTDEFKGRLAEGETLDDILPEAFAVCREAAWRSLGMKHFRVQLIGGVVLHQGRISEMKTGEGKTLVATLPAYLNALDGHGVHVVTVNDYLAKRDAEWMGKLYTFLGLKVGCVIHAVEGPARHEQYMADITYGTNNEFGFDYLRDNMVTYKEDLTQRELNYAIVDEVDSILIDEARTPLIISGRGVDSSVMYRNANTFVKTLTAEKEYKVEEKDNQVSLTDEGVKLCEDYFKIDNFSDPDNMELNHYVHQALRANYLMKRDVDYIVKDGEILIVDEFTGRLMYGRRFSNGLHQAIEAKEGVRVRSESKTLATITLQNYFRMYHKLAGMTGTASTEAGEFWSIYKLDVVTIPTNKPVIRKDEEDLIYKTRKDKFNAVIDRITELRKQGRPVLVGTTSVEVSEMLSKSLSLRKIPHSVLNAKLHAKEAEIVAQAGQAGTVTIATNMAGRGTDIKLGPGVVEAGGLAIIGTERHDSRRVDRQLRGRAGRQGDPGSSEFYVSLEDNLMRLFGADRIAKLVDRMGMKDGEVLQHKWLSSSVERAQKKVEENNFGIRKRLLEYDDVMNTQRTVIYARRNNALNGERMDVDLQNMIADFAEALASRKDEYDYEGFKLELIKQVSIDTPFDEEFFRSSTKAQMSDLLEKEIAEIIERRGETLVAKTFPIVERVYETQASAY